MCNLARKGHEPTLSALVQKTYDLVNQHVTLEASVVAAIAQRVNPSVNIEGSIAWAISPQLQSVYSYTYEALVEWVWFLCTCLYYKCSETRCYRVLERLGIEHLFSRNDSGALLRRYPRRYYHGLEHWRPSQCSFYVYGIHWTLHTNDFLLLAFAAQEIQGFDDKHCRRVQRQTRGWSQTNHVSIVLAYE